MVDLKKPLLMKGLFFLSSFIIMGVLIYNLLVSGPTFQNIIGLVADVSSIVVFIAFSGPTISDILRRRKQIEATKKDISSFLENFVKIFGQLFKTLTPSRAQVRESSEEIRSIYEKRCDAGKFDQLNSKMKLDVANDIITRFVSGRPDLLENGIRNFFAYIVLRRLGEGSIARSFIDELDEKSIFNKKSWQFTFCRCSLLFHDHELNFMEIQKQTRDMNVEKVKEHYHFLKGNLEMYRKIMKLKEDSRYRDFYEALKEQVAEILHKHEISHVALRHALASEKTDLVCLIKWAEGGYDVLGDKFEKLEWATPARGKTIQISPIMKTPVTKEFDLSQWVEEKFQLDEIDTPYRLVAIKFNIKDMVVRTYKRSDQFLRDASKGLSAERIEELVFSEAESIKELVDKSDLALLIPNFTKGTKEIIRRKDLIIRKELVKKGFRPIQSPLDLRFYEEEIEQINQVISNLKTRREKIFDTDEADRISSTFVKNAKRLAEIVLG